MNVVETENLVKRFRGGVDAVNGLDLAIEEGSVFGLIGPNGAGKTTTLRILMNLIQPTSGHAAVMGIGSTALGAEDFTRIGYVSENQAPPGWMTVQYLLDYLAPFYPTWDHHRANELVDLFALPRDRKIRALSRGMKMKAALASSLAYRPKLLVLDEPFSGLDPMMREDLVSGLAEAAEETTILISSHDLADMESFASHIGYLEAGRLEFAEEMTSLMSRFREVEVVLDAKSRVPTLGGGSWPEQWIRPEANPTLARFVDTRFDEAETRQKLARVFGDFAGVAFNPMPLRSIFVTLARNSSTRVH